MSDNGRIITISSSVVGLYHPNFGVYAATKSAVDGLTRVVAKELGLRGITVNCVSPGQVVTDLFLAGKSPEELDMYTNRIPLGRLGQPGDIAGVVAFLASADGKWVNGQVIRANGGVV
ncbi:3-oxoacyl-[acyl-carrier protein] reductase [Variovorax sp. OK212]|nr:Enoyl-(Acyl carrier protein) reductase [Variovorax sp. OK202]SFE78921.1 3-oxoacyl-[acyl-carrier protein] reductase [Variovorax sp. OK212]